MDQSLLIFIGIETQFQRPPVCPAADFLVWSILHAVFSFTDYFSFLAVQMR